MWNSEFKDQLCPWGQTNRAGKQEATGAAGPGIKGSTGVGGGGYRLAGPQSRGQLHRPISSVGIVCLPLSIVPSQRGERKEGGKQPEAAKAGWDSSTQEVFSPAGSLAFQGDYLTPPPCPSFTKAAEVSPIKAVPSLSHPTLALGPRRDLPDWKARTLCLRLPERERRVLSGPQTLRRPNISKDTLETNTELPTFHFG